jgi:hypothetical protein
VGAHEIHSRSPRKRARVYAAALAQPQSHRAIADLSFGGVATGEGVQSYRGSAPLCL